MSVSRNDDGTIVLEGDCPVEDAQVLLRLFQAAPTSPLDWTRCTHLHTAVLQSYPRYSAYPDRTLRRWLDPALGLSVMW
jgi:hypothetical protein